MPDEQSGQDVEDRLPRGIEENPVAETVHSNHPVTIQAATNRQVRADMNLLKGRINSAEKWMIGLTAAIAFSAFCQVGTALLQWHVMEGQLAEMKTGGVDTHELAVQARNQADRTKDLADKMGDSVKQASRLARATEIANANVLATDRPWVGIGIHADNLVVGNVPTATVSLFNTGKRPAKVINMQYQGNSFRDFPKNPPFVHLSELQSTGILIPGYPVATTYKLIAGDGKVTQATLDPLLSRVTTLFLYAKVEYLDVRTGQSHFTHGCWQYIPVDGVFPKGWYSCSEYQDAN